jgi:short subunit dehydrogenase-like uncharacterized protein
MKDKILIYGVTGYTGALIAQEAVKQGIKPVIGGRNADKLQKIAAELGVEYRAFGIENAADALHDVKVLLNCAGPFKLTSELLARACIAAGTHYLDIAGEVPEFETIAKLANAAQAAGVMLMPGVGFGVVPTDCVALYLTQQLPDATNLTLAFKTVGGASRGTVVTVLSDIHNNGVVRRNGQLESAPPAWKSRKIAFESASEGTVYNPWRGDLITAYYSTGIPNIETYAAFPANLQFMMKLARRANWLFKLGFVQNFLKKQMENQPEGPTPAERAAGKAFVWGEVTNTRGEKRVARLETPEAYDATALTAVAILRKISAGQFTSGFKTPAQVYGADFVLEIPGFKRTSENSALVPTR